MMKPEPIENRVPMVSKDLKIEVDTHRRLTYEAARLARSVSSIIREAINDWLQAHQ